MPGAGCHTITKKELNAMLQHPLRTPPIRYTPSGLRLFYACSTVTLSGQIPEKCKLKYQLAKHTEQELQAGEGPLGFLNNKLMAFGQSETLNGRDRYKTELQDELLHDIPGLETVEYLKTSRPAKLKLPPVAVLTFRTEKTAAACYTYRANSVPLVPLRPNQAAGHLSIKNHAEQQLSYTDR
ncbi:hypothetical protein ABBQ38_013901 [Trebouxia sp. C0009 RCD-2024]